MDGRMKALFLLSTIGVTALAENFETADPEIISQYLSQNPDLLNEISANAFATGTIPRVFGLKVSQDGAEVFVSFQMITESGFQSKFTKVFV